MKKINILLLMLFVSFSALKAENDELELGKRFVKLGNTYREAKNFNKAADFLKKGIDILEKYNSWDGKYWSAVGEEFYGYFYRDLGMKEEALHHFGIAEKIYRELITMEDGSDQAVENVRASLQSINVQKNEIRSGNTPVAGLKVLSFNDQNLRNVPASVPEDVENLSLSDNNLREFDYRLLEFKNLKYLDLSMNNIRELPSADQMAKLNGLLWLDLSDNKLKRADISVLCGLTNLGVLDLSKNEIEFEQLTNLIKCLPNTQIIHDKYELTGK
jgi:Leucine-rich repeat (LRR) protein